MDKSLKTERLDLDASDSDITDSWYYCKTLFGSFLSALSIRILWTEKFTLLFRHISMWI